jgi:hypothetical protein
MVDWWGRFVESRPEWADRLPIALGLLERAPKLAPDATPYDHAALTRQLLTGDGWLDGWEAQLSEGERTLTYSDGPIVLDADDPRARHGRALMVLFDLFDSTAAYQAETGDVCPDPALRVPDAQPIAPAPSADPCS